MKFSPSSSALPACHRTPTVGILLPRCARRKRPSHHRNTKKRDEFASRLPQGTEVGRQ